MLLTIGGGVNSAVDDEATKEFDDVIATTALATARNDGAFVTRSPVLTDSAATSFVPRPAMNQFT